MKDINTLLFFKINSLLGRNKWLDSFGRAGAEFVIVGMIGWFVAAAFIKGLPVLRDALMPIIFLMFALCVGWIISLIEGLTLRQSRPFVFYPEAKVLFNPLASWKTFPSDHTMAAFSIFFTALIFNLPGAWALLPLALWVAWGRVYAGVHYPLDIVGGIAIAVAVSLVAYLVYGYVM